MPSTTAFRTTVQEMAWHVMTAAATQHFCGPLLPYPAQREGAEERRHSGDEAARRWTIGAALCRCPAASSGGRPARLLLAALNAAALAPLPAGGGKSSGGRGCWGGGALRCRGGAAPTTPPLAYCHLRHNRQRPGISIRGCSIHAPRVKPAPGGGERRASAAVVVRVRGPLASDVSPDGRRTCCNRPCQWQPLAARGSARSAHPGPGTHSTHSPDHQPPHAAPEEVCEQVCERHKGRQRLEGQL